MKKVPYKDGKFDSEHEAICSILFRRYGWEWEYHPKVPFGRWRPDFLLRGDTKVLVECKATLEWNAVRDQDLQKYEDAVKAHPEYEALLIPKSPRNLKRRNVYDVSALGYLYDGEVWSYAELGRWSGRVGFCHSGNSWKDRMSGERMERSWGEGPRPNAELDWRSAVQIFKGKKVSFFKESVDSEIQEWVAPE